MATRIDPESAPALSIPSSSSIISISIVDSTSDLVCTARDSVSPVLEGQTYLNMATWVFYLEHKATGKRLLYDAGSRKDWWNLTPDNVSTIENELPGMRIERNINEILLEGGVDDKSIDAVIWSHHHHDHIGDMSLFPTSTELVVGPGFKEELMPGYPTDPEAILLDSDFAGREVHEISFKDSKLTIGGFPAHDFFNDGSFYLLDTPGHEVAHLSALVRTTPTTFIILGGDICDAPQAWRPTRYQPLPAEIPVSVPLDSRFPRPCPCQIFTKCHPAASSGEVTTRTTPFSRVSDAETSLYLDPEVAQRSVDAMKVFDADPNVLICVAHDAGLRSVLDFFPKDTLNDWKDRGWKEATAWEFVNELPVDGKPGRPLHVDGLYKGTERVRLAEDKL